METNEYQWKAARISLQRNRKTRGKIKIKFGVDFNDGMEWNAVQWKNKRATSSKKPKELVAFFDW